MGRFQRQLAVAYNAGSGNVGKWLKSRGNLPTDAFIESIPFERPGIIKRVLGTYQVMHRATTTQNSSSTFVDLSAYNHQAKPEK